MGGGGLIREVLCYVGSAIVQLSQRLSPGPSPLSSRHWAASLCLCQAERKDRGVEIDQGIDLAAAVSRAC